MLRHNPETLGNHSTSYIMLKAVISKYNTAEQTSFAYVHYDCALDRHLRMRILRLHQLGSRQVAELDNCMDLP